MVEETEETVDETEDADQEEETSDKTNEVESGKLRNVQLPKSLPIEYKKFTIIPDGKDSADRPPIQIRIPRYEKDSPDILTPEDILNWAGLVLQDPEIRIGVDDLFDSEGKPRSIAIWNIIFFITQQLWQKKGGVVEILRPDGSFDPAKVN